MKFEFKVLKSPCCDAAVNQSYCEDCFEWHYSLKHYNKMCKECDGTGLSYDKFECSECFKVYEKCDLIQE